MARAAPAQLTRPIGRGVGLDERSRLIRGPPTAAQQLIGQDALVADVLRHAEHRLGHQQPDGGRSRDQPEEPDFVARAGSSSGSRFRSAGPGDRDLDFDYGSASGLALDLDPPSERFDSIPEPGQSRSPPRIGSADAVIANRK